MIPINEDLQDIKDAYSGNMQALMQAYAQDKDLMKLLVLHDMKQEKEAAEAQAALQKAPVDSRSLSEQYIEQLGLGSLKGQQPPQGMAPQGMAPQGQQPPQGMAPQGQQPPQGMAPQGQRPPQQPPQGIASQANFAQGGVVKFNEGGVPQAPQALTREKLESVGVTPEQYMELTPEGQQQVRRALESKDSTSSFFGELGDYVFNNPVGDAISDSAVGDFARGLGIFDAAPDEEEAPVNTSPYAGIITLSEADVAKEKAKVDAEAAAEAAAAEKDAAVTEAAEKVAAEKAGVAALEEARLAKEEEAFKAANTPDPALAAASAAALKNATTALAVDPAAKQAERAAFVNQNLGRDAKTARYEQLIAARQAEFDREQDPKQQRRDELSAFLRGTAKGGAAGGGQGIENYRREQRKNRMEGLASIEGLAREDMDLDTTIGGAAITSADSAADRAVNMQTRAVQTITSMSAAERDKFEANAQRAFDKNENAIRNINDAKRNELLELQIRNKQAETQYEAANNVLELYNENIKQVKDQILMSDEYAELVEDAQSGGVAEQAKVRAFIAQADAMALSLMDPSLRTLGEEALKTVRAAASSSGGARSATQILKDRAAAGI